MSDKFHHVRRFPTNDIVVWELSGAPTLEEWTAYIDTVTTWLTGEESRGRRWGVIVDPSRLKNVTAPMRRASGQWRAAHLPLIANTCICASYVANSAVIRGAITAIFWFAQPVIPVKVHGSQRESHEWLAEKMNELALT